MINYLQRDNFLHKSCERTEILNISHMLECFMLSSDDFHFFRLQKGKMKMERKCEKFKYLILGFLFRSLLAAAAVGNA